MTIEKFVEKITSYTDHSADEVKNAIKEDRFYPIGEKYEENASVSLLKMVKVNEHMDKMAEESPLSLMEYMEIYTREIEKLGITKSDMKVARSMSDTLQELYAEKLDDDKVMASGIEDMGNGVFVIKFSKVLVKDREVLPGEKVGDVFENRPISAVFVDTTPGEEGLRTFYANIDRLK